MPGAAPAGEDGVETQEMPAASRENAAVACVDKSEVLRARDARTAQAATITQDGPLQPAIPAEELRTDVMTAPPDFGQDVQDTGNHPLRAMPLPPAAIVTEAFELRRAASSNRSALRVTTAQRVVALGVLLASGFALWAVLRRC